MSSGAALGLGAMDVVFDLCSIKPSPILGGSMALVLLGLDPVSTPIHDIDLVFPNGQNARRFVSYLNDREMRSICVYSDFDPYEHWLGELRGVKFCIFVNPDVSVIVSRNGLMLQQPEEIVSARTCIGNHAKRHYKSYARKEAGLFK